MTKAKTRNSLYCLIIFTVVVFSFSFNVMAQNLPLPISLDVPQIRQQTQTWCWLAAAEMCVRYYKKGNVPSQCQIMSMAFNKECCVNPQLCNKSGTLYEIMIVVKGITGRSTSKELPMDPMELYDNLKLNKLVIAQIRSNDPKFKHVVVIRGMRFDRDGQPFLLVNDPSYTFPGEVPYWNLHSVWLDSVVVN